VPTSSTTWRPSSRSPSRQHWAGAGCGATFFGLLAYGVLIELLQSRIPGRSAEAADVLADAIGIALGLSAYALVAWWTRRT
jgi:VanZ family protein